MNTEEAIVYGRAFKPGDVVLLKMRRPMTIEQMNAFRQQVEHTAKTIGIHFVLLPHDVDIVEKNEETK